jgi:hypothetical protein
MFESLFPSKFEVVPELFRGFDRMWIVFDVRHYQTLTSFFHSFFTTLEEKLV